MATVLLSRDAARAIFGEIRRWVEQGFAAQGAPLESLVYPLSALIPHRQLLCPLELASAGDIREIVIDAAAIPPDEVKAFSPHNCHFAAIDLERVTDEFNQRIERLVQKSPRLGVNSKLHSHPFSGGAFLSSGDLHFGVTSRQATRWRQQRGLQTAILHVAYPDGPPSPSQLPWRLTRAGALASGRGGRVNWRIRSWASNNRGAMEDLGDAAIVPARHDSLVAARRPPYWRSAEGSAWCNAQKTRLRAAGYAVSRNLLGRGWRRYLVQTRQRQLLLALPPDLPAVPVRALEVQNALADQFAVLPLPRWAAQSASLAALSLVKLARHYGEPL